MSTTTDIQVPAAITGKFNIAMTEAKLQEYSNEGMKLVFNEDNLPTIADWLARGRKIIKKVDDTHKEGKASIIQVGKQWDTAKNTFTAQVTAIISSPHERYTNLCKELAEKKAVEDAEIFRVDNIRKAIDENSIWFAKRIAECTSTSQLTAIESKLNLEKTRKEKYQEFLPDAAQKFTELNSIVKTQKGIIKNLELIEKQKQDALAVGDDEKVMQLDESLADIHQHMEETAVSVQETAINQTISNDIGYTPTLTTAAPNARRTVWKYELVDAAIALKKSPELVQVVLNDEKVKEALKTLRGAGLMDGKTELIVNGVRYFESKTF